MKKNENQEPTIEELEEMLAKKKADKRNAQERERKRYEKEKDYVANNIFSLAKQASEFMADVKKTCGVEMNKMAAELENYGKFPVKSKGGFSIDNAAKTVRITRTRDTQPHWDERSEKGAQLIKDFLADSIKKKDKDGYEMLMELLTKNEAGQLEYSRVMVILQSEDRFSDARWHEGIKLLKESYSIHMKGFGYRFKFKNANGNWETLDMNFSSL
ncbi:DUF3164 family protein [Flagellimonas eckloniae]|uniref:DUF3164 family protein n=1 Tax=Flagellimonas eckloniae TaxID=346185 RepID=A0A0Q1BI27_9FLAO|nr:DUF3164 family protein [Allomuricauda eckloniae]KQC30202.1 hypothetical protein AAY42_10170 [Allomuricauda eckloniae]